MDFLGLNICSIWTLIKVFKHVHVLKGISSFEVNCYLTEDVDIHLPRTNGYMYVVQAIADSFSSSYLLLLPLILPKLTV